MNRNDSLVLGVVCVVEVCGGRGRESNQRVKMTCWCSLWPAWLREGEEKQPTSHIDSLVLCVAAVVKGEEKKGTNKL